MLNEESVKVPQIKVSSVHLEDEYMIHQLPGIAVIRVENLSFPDHCQFNLNGVSEDIQSAFHEQNWERFIGELITEGYLQ